MKGLRKMLCWLLCAVMFSGAVACTGEKGASGKNAATIEAQQEKSTVRDGKYREKEVGAEKYAADEVVVENNWLNSTEARQLDKEMQDCKASGGDCNKVVEKYVEISNGHSKELAEACTGGGVACVSWQELIQGATNVANDAHPLQFRLAATDAFL